MGNLVRLIPQLAQYPSRLRSGRSARPVKGVNMLAGSIGSLFQRGNHGAALDIGPQLIGSFQ